MKNKIPPYGLVFLAIISLITILPVQALGNVIIVSHSSYYDSLNALWIVGEVQNNGDMATEFTKITATFYDASNKVIGTDYGYSDLDVILPNAKSPFSILYLSSEGSLSVSRYTLTISWNNYAAGKQLGLQIISNTSFIDGSGYMHVTGQVKNQGSLNANFAKVFATFYDSSGTVVGTDYTYTEPTNIPSNEIASYSLELIYPQQVMKISSFSLTAESTQYAYLPTGSSPPPTVTPTPLPPTPTATQTPTQSPTVNPTGTPTSNPTNSPTVNPTTQPTTNPTPMPTQLPTNNPTMVPTSTPVQPLPTPTPTVPELPAVIMLPLLLIAFSLTVLLREHRQRKR